MFLFDRFVVDAEAGELRRNGERVKLRSKCLDLLLFLVSNRGKLLSIETILDHVWADAVVAHATVSRTVAELREALGDDAASPKFIETVPRRGYKFIAVAESAEPARRVAFLLTHEGHERPLAAGQHVIGRSSEVSIPVYARNISRRHARIVVDDHSATIEDLGSKNGTLVNGRAVEGKVPLSPGDQIRVGDETLVLWSLTDVSTEARR